MTSKPGTDRRSEARPRGSSGARLWVRRVLAACLIIPAGENCHFVDEARSASPLTRKWFAPIAPAGDMNLFQDMPALIDGAVIVAVRGELAAIDTGTGKLRWRTAIGSTVFSSHGSIAAAGSLACLVDPTGVGCVNVQTGQAVWRELNDTVTAGGVATTDGTALYYPTKHTVTARSLADGHFLWSSDVAPDVPLHAGVTAVSVRGDTLYTSATRILDTLPQTYRATLVALDRHDGRILWTHSVEPQPGNRRTNVRTPAALAGNLALLGTTEDSWLIALDVTTGAEVWRTTRDSSGYVQTWTRFTVAGDTVYAPSSDTQFYSLDLRTGQLRWRTLAPFSIWSAGLCGSSAVLVPFGGGHLWTVNRTTHAVEKSAITDEGDDVESEVAVSGATGFVMSMRGVYAFACH